MIEFGLLTSLKLKQDSQHRLELGLCHYAFRKKKKLANPGSERQLYIAFQIIAHERIPIQRQRSHNWSLCANNYVVVYRKEFGW
jgi:hypothetical protein